MTQLPVSQSTDALPRARESLQRRLELIRAEVEGLAPRDLVLCRADVPCMEPEALLRGFADRDCVLWHPSEGPCFAGIDVAHSVVGDGPDRFGDVRRAGAELWARLRVPEGGRQELAVPRLFGGFAFSAGGASSDAWSQFGPARFVLPRVTYAVHRNAALLTLAIERSELDRGAESEHWQLFQRVIEGLGAPARVFPSPEAEEVSRQEPSAEAFQLRVEDLLGRIARGELQKVVAAREVQLGFSGDLDPLATVVALREQASECLRFLFRWGNAAFVGATPERLLHKRGSALETEALAGSIAAAADSPEHRLRASPKELEEHRLVVTAITRALEPLCELASVPERPGVRRLKHILHLCTPIHGTLNRDTHVLDLLERLHPTPAVGGVPTLDALAWILEHEPFDRGWYSGAVGWFDAFGDGDFNVALRSGLIRSNQAWLYAGAGIVRDSVAVAEYAETTLKLSAVLASLRASA